MRQCFPISTIYVYSHFLVPFLLCISNTRIENRTDSQRTNAIAEVVDSFNSIKNGIIKKHNYMALLLLFFFIFIYLIGKVNGNLFYHPKRKKKRIDDDDDDDDNNGT